MLVEPVAGGLGRGPARRRASWKGCVPSRGGRRPARLRRGDDRLARPPDRCPGAVRRAARHHHSRQSGGWRPPGRGLRWRALADGADRAGGPGLSGGHAVRQPARDGGRAGHARCPGTSRHLGASRGMGSAGGRRHHGGRRGCRSGGDGPAGGHNADAVLHRLAGPELRRCEAVHRVSYSAFFHAMLDGGVYLAPSAFEAAFTSAAHGDAELAAFETALGSAWAR